jgi:hypothetical protein
MRHVLALVVLVAGCGSDGPTAVIGGGDLGVLDLATPDLATPDLASSDLGPPADLAGFDAGAFACKLPALYSAGAFDSRDCPSGSYCCGDATMSVCIANATPALTMLSYCNPSNVIDTGPPYPTCEAAGNCRAYGQYKGNYCCPSAGGPNFCLLDHPFAGCAFVPTIGPCTTDDLCQMDARSAGYTSKCVNNVCVIQ